MQLNTNKITYERRSYEEWMRFWGVESFKRKLTRNYEYSIK